MTQADLLTTRSLAECQRIALKSNRIDTEKGVIYGVKILGLESRNGRRYLPESLRKAARLYEGRSVRVDHPGKPGDQRSSSDIMGRLVNVRLEEDGLYGDLEYLKSHPISERLVEAAIRMPEQFGLSHNAEGEGETVDSTFIVHEITEVHSVDLVADPATTRGLFESEGQREETMKIKMKSFFEAVQKRLKGPQARKLQKLLEMGMYGDEEEMAIDEEDPAMDVDTASPEEALAGGFRSAIAAYVDQALEGDTEAMSKVQELIKAHQKLAPAAVEEEEELEVEDDEEDVELEEEEQDLEEAEDEDEMTESLKKKKKLLDRKDKAYDLCEQAGIFPDKLLVEALVAMPTDELMTKLVAREKKAQAKKPKTQSATSLTESEGSSGGDFDYWSNRIMN